MQKKQKTKELGFLCEIQVENGFLRQHPLLSCWPPSVVVGNPISKNPCSYEAVKAVLLDIKTATQVLDKRSWTVLGCDGLQYLLASKMFRKNDDLQDLLLLPALGHWEMNMTKGFNIVKI